MGVKISPKILKKLLENHKVTRKEVIECFENMEQRPLEDNREDHKTDPPTFWIISETNHQRKLKVCYMVNNGDAVVKSVYKPEPEAEDIYRRKAPYLF